MRWQKVVFQLNETAMMSWRILSIDGVPFPFCACECVACFMLKWYLSMCHLSFWWIENTGHHTSTCRKRENLAMIIFFHVSAGWRENRTPFEMNSMAKKQLKLYRNDYVKISIWEHSSKFNTGRTHFVDWHFSKACMTRMMCDVTRRLWLRDIQFLRLYQPDFGSMLSESAMVRDKRLAYRDCKLFWKSHRLCLLMKIIKTSLYFIQVLYLFLSL